MDKSKWVWMPHAGHFIGGNNCRFHLATYVGGYIVSTVGELLWDSNVREILAQSRGVALEGRGDDRETDYMKKIGFEDIGLGRKYETMVFKAKKSKHKCCPWQMTKAFEMETAGYNDSGEAFKGHLEMCEKWSKCKGEPK